MPLTPEKAASTLLVPSPFLSFSNQHKTMRKLFPAPGGSLHKVFLNALHLFRRASSNLCGDGTTSLKNPVNQTTSKVVMTLVITLVRMEPIHVIWS